MIFLGLSLNKEHLFSLTIFFLIRAIWDKHVGQTDCGDYIYVYICVYMCPYIHVRWVSYHHGMARPKVADGGDALQVWRVATNILNKQSRAADKG
jgi:hypothetical protein